MSPDARPAIIRPASNPDIRTRAGCGPFRLPRHPRRDLKRIRRRCHRSSSHLPGRWCSPRLRTCPPASTIPDLRRDLPAYILRAPERGPKSASACRGRLPADPPEASPPGGQRHLIRISDRPQCRAPPYAGHRSCNVAPKLRRAVPRPCRGTDGPDSRDFPSRGTAHLTSRQQTRNLAPRRHGLWRPAHRPAVKRPRL